MNKLKNKLAPVMIIIAGCLWGAMGLFVRRLNGWGIESMSVVFIRALFTAAITFAITAVFDRKQLKIRLRFQARCSCGMHPRRFSSC